LPDLDTRFRSFRRVPAPELWSEIERREPSPPPSPPLRPRIVAAAVALLIAAAGFAFAERALSERGSAVRHPVSASTAGVRMFRPEFAGTVSVGGLGTSLTAADGVVWASVNTGFYRIDESTNASMKLAYSQGPWAVATESGSVWMAGWIHGNGEVIQQLDLDTGDVLATIDLGPKWSGASFLVAEAGSLWASVQNTDTGELTLLQVDPNSSRIVGEVGLRDALPSDMKDQTMINVAAGDGYVWLVVWDFNGDVAHSGYLLRFNPTSGRVDGRVSIGPSSFLAVGYGYVWTNMATGDTRGPVRINTTSLDVEPIGLSDFVPFAADAGSVWFLSRVDGQETLGALDPQTLKETESVAVPSKDHGSLVLGGNASASGLSFDPSTRSVWFLSEDGTIFRFDLLPDTGTEETTRQPIAGKAITGASTPQDLWVASCTDCPPDLPAQKGQLVHVDPATGRVLGSLQIDSPGDVAASNGVAWVLDFTGGSISRVDASSNEVTSTTRLTLPADREMPDGSFLPSNVAFGEGAIWVATTRGALAKIDPTSNAVEDMIPLPSETTGDVAAGAGGVWVCEDLLGLYRIDPQTGAVVDKIRLPRGNELLSPSEVAVIGGHVLVIGDWSKPITDQTGAHDYQTTRDRAIVEIDPGTDKVVSTIDSGYARFVEGDGQLWIDTQGEAEQVTISPLQLDSSARVDLPGRLLSVAGGQLWVQDSDGSIVPIAEPR
jgi:streptogramin lyase